MILAIGSFLLLVLVVLIVYASIAVGKESDKLMMQMQRDEWKDEGDLKPDDQEQESKDPPE